MGAAVVLGTMGLSPPSPKSFDSHFSALRREDWRGINQNTERDMYPTCPRRIPPAKSSSVITGGSNTVTLHNSKQTESLWQAPTGKNALKLYFFMNRIWLGLGEKRPNPASGCALQSWWCPVCFDYKRMDWECLASAFSCRLRRGLSGVFGRTSPFKNVSGLVVLPKRLQCLQLLSNLQEPTETETWIVLIRRRWCTFTSKIKCAASVGAIGAITYQCPSVGNEAFPMICISAEDTVTAAVCSLEDKGVLCLI